MIAPMINVYTHVPVKEKKILSLSLSVGFPAITDIDLPHFINIIMPPVALYNVALTYQLPTHF